MKLYFTVQRLRNRYRAAIWTSTRESLTNELFLCSVNAFDTISEAKQDGKALLQFVKVARAIGLRPYQQIVIDSLTDDAGGLTFVVPMGAGKATR